jgi:hybrid cluster-associated redox disulfide protein
MMKVTETMLLSDILDMDPDPTEIFLRHGLNCLGCPGARSENLKEAAEGHGIDLKKLINDLNEFLENN